MADREVEAIYVAYKTKSPALSRAFCWRRYLRRFRVFKEIPVA